MKKSITLIATLLLSNLAWANEGLTSPGLYKNQSYTTAISYELLAKSSDWKPEKGEVPVSPTKALQLSKAAILKEFPNFGAIKVNGIALSETNKSTWLYKVTISRKLPAENKDDVGLFTYFVLLNGDLISPKNLAAK